MKRSTSLVLLVLALTAAVLAAPAAAQSRNRDRPTILKTNEINGTLDGSGNEIFYTFLAGPGKVTLTVDVQSETGQALLNFELLDSDAAGALLCCEYAQADGDGQSARVIKSVDVDKQQKVVLKVTIGKAGKGTYRVQLAGAVGFIPSSAP